MLPCQGVFRNAHQPPLTGVPNLPLQFQGLFSSFFAVNIPFFSPPHTGTGEGQTSVPLFMPDNLKSITMNSILNACLSSRCF